MPEELEELMSLRELAEYLNREVPTIRAWRLRGYGPAGFLVGGRVMYRRSVVNEFIDECEREQRRHDYAVAAKRQ